MKARLLLRKVFRRFVHYVQRFLWRCQCSVSPNKVASFKLVDGSRFDYPLNSAIGWELFTGTFEIAELSFVRSSVRPGDIFLDVGANGGIFTVIAAKQVGPHGHVYAFEPGSRELEILRRNITLNNLSNVTVVPCAVSDRSGQAQFAISRDGALNSMAQTNRSDQQIQQWVTVHTLALDDFVNEFSIQRVDFIKIDIEGAERLALKGAKKTLASNKQVTVLFEACELNTSGFGYSVQDLLSDIINSGLFLCYPNKAGGLSSVKGYEDRFSKGTHNFVARWHSAQ
jgi:FkbM family methyltransferase